MDKKEKIIILGAGYAGIDAARYLSKKNKKLKNLDITVIDKKSHHTMMTELHEVAGGRCEPESVRVRYDKIFAGKKIKFISDSILTIDFTQKILHSSFAEYPFDYLIIGIGAEPDFFNVEGAKENSLTLWGYEDAIRIRRHVDDCFHKAAAEPSSENRRKLLTFTVAGAGFTGIEIAGELLEWIKELTHEYGINSQEAKVNIVEAMADVLPIMDKKLRIKTLKFLNKKGATVQLNSLIKKITPDGYETKDGFVPSSTVIWTCGIKGNAFSGMLPELSEPKNLSQWQAIGVDPKTETDENLKFNIRKKNRLITNSFLQSVDQPSVYIIGDVLWFKDSHHVLPQIVETAIQSGECAAENILLSIEGKSQKVFAPKYHGLMVSIGSRYAVADVMGMKLSGFLAMASKHFVHLHYLFSIGGINMVWAYLQFRFLSVKGKKSFIGGHFAYKYPGYWIIPLRLYLGVMWLFESIGKINSGWLNSANNFVVFKKAAAVTGDLLSSVTAAIDAVTEASTEAVAQSTQPVADALTAATAVASDNANSAVAAVQSTVDVVATATTAAAVTVQKALLSKPFFLYQWFTDTVVAKVPFLFQAGITIAELLIGLALIGGLFVVPASAASIVLCLMFILGAVAGPEIFWFMIAALVMFGGAGRQVGLDYYLMPALKKFWNGRKIVQRWKIYTGQPELRKNKNRPQGKA